MNPIVTAVFRSPTHSFSKEPCESIQLIAGVGVEGDAHAGVTVKHRSRVKADPTQPNLRQVHLMHAELFDELRIAGFDVLPGQLGENVTTGGINLLALPKGTRLKIGATAIIEITGLRNPCSQIENFRTGLLAKVVSQDCDGQVRRKAGVMSVVITGGIVQVGDEIEIELPALPHVTLERV